MSEGIKAVDDWIRSPLVASHVPLDAEPRFDKAIVVTRCPQRRKEHLLLHNRLLWQERVGDGNDLRSGGFFFFFFFFGLNY